MENQKLYILWTNADEVTAEKMVFMYGINSLLNHWWEEVTLVIWGSTAKLAVTSPIIKEKIAQAISVGMRVSACKACADQLGVTEELLALGVEIKYWGVELTEILKSNEKLITI